MLKLPAGQSGVLLAMQLEQLCMMCTPGALWKSWAFSAPALLNAYDYTGLCQVRREGSWAFIWTQSIRTFTPLEEKGV